MLLAIIRDTDCVAARILVTLDISLQTVYLMITQILGEDLDDVIADKTGRAQGGGKLLEQYSLDLTKKAAERALDPVIGRENEIARVIQILSRRTKNNPCSLEGQRPILVEIQALVCRTSFGFPRRTANGADYNRVNLLMAVLEKRVGLKLSDCDAYVNLAGGIRMNEPAMDLGIVMALISSFRDRPISSRTMVFGEVGLSGEVRGVSLPEQRVAEAKKLGFTRCIVPKVCLRNLSKIKGIEIIGVSSVRDAMDIE